MKLGELTKIAKEDQIWSAKWSSIPWIPWIPWTLDTAKLPDPAFSWEDHDAHGRDAGTPSDSWWNRAWRWWTQWHSNATVATAKQTGATLRLERRTTEMIIAEGTKWSAVRLEVTDVTDLKNTFFWVNLFILFERFNILLVQGYGRKGGTILHSMIFVWN